MLASSQMDLRPRVSGKFLSVGEQKFYVRGVTYGTFRPNEDGEEYPSRNVVERDFAQIAANGLNSVRTYTVPPRWLLDVASRHGLRVMVGLPWEQHVMFLDDEERARAIETRVRAGVRACAGHPAVLCYAIGNEIPASVVRWHGRRRTERFLERLYRAAKDEDPAGLVTYVNYPTTEYLQLPFVDVVCFNVYLESQDRLDAYLARLQNLAGDRPLIMAEIGLDSRRNGEDVQACTLAWQVRTAFASGCAGAFVFAWTDEWHRGGHEIEDWDFGLTTRDRQPKLALAAVRAAFAEVPFPADHIWPRISVVVCSHNGGRTIRDCCEALLKVEYPDFEVIVVNDGSTDNTEAIARKYPFRVISTENRGLSSARNTGMRAATGEIIAYLDDDAWPDPDWLKHLAHTFLTTDYVGVGGPNIAPPDDGEVADAVAYAPGGPVHVLLSDREAEHVPGCNMAVRKAALEAVGGFDPHFRVAGDDVDLCWRLQEKGWRLGFNPAAVVWHHQRNTVGAHWRQQLGYGKAEALLEAKWPEKYNAAGHVRWGGRVYAKGPSLLFGWTSRIYHGRWGGAPFQSLHEQAPGMLRSLSMMPEWYLIVLGLGIISVLGLFWSPLLLALPLFVLAAGTVLVEDIISAAKIHLSHPPPTAFARLRLRALIAFLHLLQPAARLCGRVRYGLVPWRRRASPCLTSPRPRTVTLWSESWQEPEQKLWTIDRGLRADEAMVLHGGVHDRWDLEIRGGLLGAVRLRMGTEEHGAGKQLFRFRLWPRWSFTAIALTFSFAALAIGAAADAAWVASAILGGIAAISGTRAVQECCAAMAATLAAVRKSAEPPPAVVVRTEGANKPTAENRETRRPLQVAG